VRSLFKSLLPLSLVLSCSSGSSGTSGINKLANKGAYNGSIRSDNVATITDNYKSVDGAGFTVKNYLQLKSATEQCLGAGLGIVTSDMFTPGVCPKGKNMGALPADKKAILGADKCDWAANPKGMNVLDGNKSRLWDPESAARTATLANTLNPDYLSALAEVADVYAHGVPDPVALCGTIEAATKLLGGCLSQYEPAALSAAANALQSSCSKGPAEARAAIATMIGSAAFSANSKL